MRLRLFIILAICHFSAFKTVHAGELATAWSSDGKTLVYLSSSPEFELRLANTSSSGSQLLLDRQGLAKLVPRDGIGKVAEQGAGWNRLWLAGGSVILASCHQIVSLDLNSRVPRVLLSSGDPLESIQISPNNQWVSFHRRYNIELLDLRTGLAHRLTTKGSPTVREGSSHPAVQSAFDTGASYWWAPDSSAIAYLETEAADQDLRSGSALPRTRIWSSAIPTGKTHCLNAGDLDNAYVVRANWMDNRRVAVQVLNREQTALSLLIADSSPVKPKPAALVLKETDRYWVNPGKVFYVFKDGRRLLWSSERSGYRHLFVYDLEAHAGRALTSGSWEVEAVSHVDESARQVYFTATMGGAIERQLYRVSLDEPQVTRVTERSGTHSISFAPGGGAFLDTWSDIQTPPERFIRALNGITLHALDSARVPHGSSMRREFLTIRTHDGMRLDALLVRPARFDPHAKYPVILEVNGRPGQQLVRNQWDGPRYRWHEAMASAGYMVLSIDCRGSGGHGHLFEEPLHYRLGAQETSDVRDAVDWLWNISYIDRGRIGIWGAGYNGSLSLFSILAEPNRIKAAVSIAPVIDWRGQSAPFVERFLGLPQSHHDEYEKSSVLESTGRLLGRLLVITPNQPASPSNDMGQLRKFLQKGPASPEFAEASTNWEELFQTMTEFFADYL